MDKYMKRLEQNAQQKQRREISDKKREKKLQGAKGAGGAARARKRPQQADASDSAPGADSQPHKTRRKADFSGAGVSKGTGGAGKQPYGNAAKPQKKLTKRERDLSRTYGEVVVKAKVRTLPAAARRLARHDAARRARRRTFGTSFASGELRRRSARRWSRSCAV